MSDSPLRILHLEDDPNDAELVEATLSEAGVSFDMTRLEDRDSFRSAVEDAEASWDVVLADYKLPSFSGFEALELLRKRDEELPFILVSSYVGEHLAVECLKKGATDYVLKDRLGRLASAIRRALEEASERRARRRAEAARERLITVMEQSAENIVVTDPKGTIEYVNPAFEETFGYSPEEVLGRNPRLWKSGRHDQSFFREFWETIKGKGETWRGRMWNQRKDGTLFAEDKTVSPIRNEEGKVVSFVSLGRDVTRMIEMEEQLRQAQKMEAVGQLAAGVAHDFNNILTVIQGCTSMSLDVLGREHPVREEIKEIELAASRAAALTQQLLIFGRRKAVNERILDLNRLILDLESMLRRLIPEYISISLDLSSDVPKILADPGQLEQVVVNLAVNARDAMPAGGELSIRTERVDITEEHSPRPVALSPGSYATLIISDSGTGMPPEVQARAFDPFFTTKAQGQGTGLGLSTVFGQVKQLGGHIELDSEVGVGSLFRIHLPASKPAAPTSRAEARDSKASLQQGTETILVVEDDRLVRRLAVRILSSRGYQVLSAGGAEEALRLADEHPGPIDLLFTDVVMPGMSGPELSDRFLELRPDSKVLLTSGYTGDVLNEQNATGVGVAMLGKPYDKEGLLRMIRSVLDDG